MQETAVRFAICDDDKVYAEKMKALILQTFHLPQPVECVIYLNQEQIPPLHSPPMFQLLPPHPDSVLPGFIPPAPQPV